MPHFTAPRARTAASVVPWLLRFVLGAPLEQAEKAKKQK
jgi:hypothetical protein